MIKSNFYDALYGNVVFPSEILDLISAPLVQRLRHVRLSNIDSIASPGIANISRFEHALGVATLAAHTSFYAALPKYDQLLIQSAALLHDWAITAFGHLVEEAYAYAGAKFVHESKLSELVSGDDGEIGGVERQIIGGRETGLRKWAKASVGVKNADKLILDITETIQGGGKFGKVIAGTMDIDNIDNVYRVAHHLGFEYDRSIPNSLATAIKSIDQKSGSPLFANDSDHLIQAWLEMRERVYDRLMLSEPDFCAKLMMICAVVSAYRAGEISDSDWNMTDQELITKLRSSRDRECKETVNRWMVGEYWDSSSLIWMEGSRPTFAELNKFNDAVSERLGRKIFSYCIKDKRKRALDLCFENGSSATFGLESQQWLLGIASPVRKKFISADDDRFINCAEEFFNTKFLAKAGVADVGEVGGEQICLI